MFRKVHKTAYPPALKPLMVWDGQCGFCKYWIIRWKRATGDRIEYAPYQEVSSNFPDIPEERFEEAVRLINTAGDVYSGPQAAFEAYALAGRWKFLSWLYNNFPPFRWLNDHGYQWIADHRSFMYRLTVALFGDNPKALKPYWLYYLLGSVTLAGAGYILVAI